MTGVNAASLDRLSRLVVIGAAAAAIATGVWIASRLWVSLPWVTALAFIAAFIVGRRWPGALPAVVLLPACLFPSLVREIAGGVDSAHRLLWLAALLGGVLGLTGWRAWALPRIWRILLVHGALCVAVGWLLISARELDWTIRFLQRGSVSVTAQGVYPSIALIWIACVAAVQLVALLWIDALWTWMRERRPADFERGVIWPVLASAAIGAMVACVQMFWAIEWLNSGMFAFLDRASGLLLDANTMGMTTALGMALAMALAFQAHERSRRYTALAASGLLIVATWGSGSRTALLVALAALAAAAAIVGLRWMRGGQRALPRVAAGLIALALLGVLLVRSTPQTVGPVARLTGWLSNSSERSVSSTVKELWDRDGYGIAGAAMIGDYPWTGVGPGMFHLMVLDYTFLTNYPVRLPTDNAQNWWRHQLAETGVLGAIGWCLWSGVFGWWLVRSRVYRQPAGAILSASLAGLAAASLVSMPTQHPSVLIMAATMVFWVWVLSGEASDDRAPGRAAWLAVWAGAVLFAAMTQVTAQQDLRVPYRALKVGRSYSDGWYATEQSGSGPFRWSRKHAVAVFPATGGYLRLRFWARHQDIDTRPVDVRISLRDELIVDTQLRDKEPAERYVYVPSGRPWLMIETEVDRTFQATEGGRDLGLAVSDWTFVSRPPEDAIVIVPKYEY